MSSPGKLVIGVMLLVAVSLASFGIWYNRGRTLKSLEFYGSEGVALVGKADHVELFRLSGDTPDGQASWESIELPGLDQTALITQRIDGAQVRGLIHVRQALLVDGSYDWRAGGSDCRPNWDYGMRFGQDKDQFTLLFSMNCSRLLVVESGKSVSIKPISQGLKKFLDEQFAESE